MSITALAIISVIAVAEDESRVNQRQQIVIQRLDGERSIGAGLTWESDREAILHKDQDEQRLAKDDILSVEFGLLETNSPAKAVRLANGDLIFTHRLTFDDLTIQTTLGGTPLEIPIEFVHCLMFNTSPRQLTLPDLNEEDFDVVQLANDDVVRGDVVRGTSATVFFESEFGQLELPIANVNSLQLNLQLMQKLDRQRPVDVLYFRDGSFVHISEFQTIAGGQVRIQLECGIVLECDSSRLQRLDRFSDQIFEWSNLPIENISGRDFFGKEPVVAVGQNLQGQTLLTGGHFYSTGIGVSSGTRCLLTVPPRARAFSVVVGFDDRQFLAGSVVVGIKQGDQRLFIEELDGRKRSCIIIRSLEVDGSRDLELEVDFGAQADLGDQVNWCLPRFHLAR